MNVRRFTATTSREAWRDVREALGPDAVILSNRTVNGMIEILALAPEDMSALSEPVVEKPVVSAATLAAFSAAPQVEPAVPAASQRSQEAPPARAHAGDDQAANLAETLAANRAPSHAAADEFAQVMKELRSMRGMLESQLAEIAFSTQQKREPGKSSVMRELLAAGFSASLARYLTQNMPRPEADGNDAVAWVKSVLARNLNVLNNENEILEKGGVYALVGPTGVGKTTTTAKLAARCVMRHGAGKLALITTDGYRIGAYEQLRIYGKILGVMVHSVKDDADLRIALAELKSKHTVLIDTVGMGQRDKMVAEQIAMLSGSETPVKRLLCLSATSTGETLNEVVRSYRGGGLAGCIMTKLDEAATVGNVLDVMIRQKLPLYYIANGQRVPEDLHLPNRNYLIDRAFKLKRETAPFQYQDDELPLLIGTTAAAMHDKALREVSIG